MRISNERWQYVSNATYRGYAHFIGQTGKVKRSLNISVHVAVSHLITFQERNVREKSNLLFSLSLVNATRNTIIPLHGP